MTLFGTLVVLLGLALAYNATLEASLDRDVQPEDIGLVLSTEDNTGEDIQLEEVLPDAIEPLPEEVPQPEDDSGARANSSSIERVGNSSDPLDDGEPENSTVEPVRNDTIKSNQTDVIPPIEPVENLTEDGSEANQTVPPPVEEKEKSVPEMNVEIEGNEKLTRGASSIFHAIVTNGGSIAKNVDVRWVLPLGFVVLSEEGSNCGDLERGESCASTIEVTPLLAASLGGISVDVKVSYK